MRSIDVFRIAFSTFRNNKMRTFLTIFGVSVGIGAIVFLFSFGYGIQRITIGDISSIKALSTFNITSGNSSIINLNNETVGKIKKIENVTGVYPNLSISGQISFADTKTDLIISAVPPEYVDLESPRMEAGGIYQENNGNEIVLSSAIVKAFNTKNEDIISKSVLVTMYLPDQTVGAEPRLVQKKFVVTGIIKDTATAYSYVPSGSIELPSSVTYTVVKAKMDDTKNMVKVKEDLAKMGLQSSSVGEKVEQMNRIFNIAKIILLIFGAIALFVASIGMFNTLTISLLERTKDIGIMKALGATDREVYFIFLSESTLISLAGGALGIIIAFILGTALNVVVAVLATNAGGEAVKIIQIPILFSLFILFFSFLIGLVTGLYPSKRAAKLNPLDALRYE